MTAMVWHGDNADTDGDNDQVDDTADAFPLDASESVDIDADGVGNNADTDDDGDGVADTDDAFPLISIAICKTQILVTVTQTIAIAFVWIRDVGRRR